MLKPIAERSGWLIGGTLFLWITTVGVASVEISMKLFDNFTVDYTSWLCLTLLIVSFGSALYYAYWLWKTPSIIIEYDECGNCLIIHTNRREERRINPQEIGSINQRNLSGSGLGYKSGNLTLIMNSGEKIHVRWIKQVDDARNQIDVIRQTQILKRLP